MEKANAIGTNGFRRVFFGIQNENEDVVDVVSVDEVSGGAIELKTSGFAGQSNVVYASNIAYYTSDAGTGTGKVDLTIVEMPSDLVTKVLGDSYEDGIYVTRADVVQPYVSLIAESQDLKGNPMWIGVSKVKFTTTDAENLKTAEDKGKTPNSISLNGSAVTRKVDRVVKAKATSSDGTTLAKFASKLFLNYKGKLDDSLQVDESNTNKPATNK